jgi:hypothetical protein
MVTIASEGDPTNSRTNSAFFIVEPNRGQLVEITTRLDVGDQRGVVDIRIEFYAWPQESGSLRTRNRPFRNTAIQH